MHEALRGTAALLDDAGLNLSEKQVAEARLRLNFRKSPDIPLAEHIRNQKRHRR